MVDVLVQLKEVVVGEGDGALVALDLLARVSSLDVGLQGDFGEEGLGTDGAALATGNDLLVLREGFVAGGWARVLGRAEEGLAVVRGGGQGLAALLLLFEADLALAADPLWAATAAPTAGVALVRVASAVRSSMPVHVAVGGEGLAAVLTGERSLPGMN